jgi:hypothetical protein
MDEAGFRADDLGQVGQEGDDVMLGFALDLVDAVDVEGGIAPLSQTSSAASLGITPSSACASQAWASISNQMRNFDSGDQMATISGRDFRAKSNAGSQAARR